MKSYLFSIINKCGSKESVIYLRILSFIESIFFPIPTDVLLAPMVLSKKHNWIDIAITASIWSVLGGVIGYILGFYLFDFIEPYLYHFDKYKRISKSRSLYIRAFLINQGISHNRIKIETNEENVTKNWKNEVILNFIGV